MNDPKDPKAEAKIARKADKLVRKEARRADRQLVVHRQFLDLPATIELLEKTLEQLKAGSVSVEHGDDRMELEPASHLQLKLRAKKTHKKESFSFSISWPLGST